MEQNGSWEDAAGLDADAAAAYYDYYASLFLEAVPVPGDAYVRALRERTEALFNLQKEDEAAKFLAFGENEAQARQQELAVDRTHLFRGTDSAGIKPPYASFWTGEERAGLAYAVRAYREAGLAKTEGNHEREDYAGCELAFAARLAAAEAQAASENDAAKASALRAARQTFCNEHMALWLPAYCEQATEGAQTGFFRTMLGMLAEMLGDEDR